MKKKVIIMGAAGRDFHNFNICFRHDAGSRVVAFTATQIPYIEKRSYPPALSGPLYPDGIPIFPEKELPELIKKESVDEVVFSYSDVPYSYVMERASLCASLGAAFVLPGADKTMLKSTRPVVSVCAVRTGCGKSGVTRVLARLIKDAGLQTVAIRHPMPYGDLLSQRLQRFTSIDDIRASGCTVEEMEEYEPLVEAGITVFAGVDYEEILHFAEKEAQIIIWDGGNNDLPFIKPDVELVVVDPLRPGDELAYWPGAVNLARADTVIINKVNSASAEDIASVTANIRLMNPDAGIIKTASKVAVHGDVAGKKVLVIEDGPTLTHGGMSYGAGMKAAQEYGAEPVDPRPHARGSIKETFEKYPHISCVLPAVGYSKEQLKDLEETVNATPCDAVLVATPVDLARIIDINKESVRVSYEVEDTESPGLKGLASTIAERFS